MGQLQMIMMDSYMIKKVQVLFDNIHQVRKIYTKEAGR